MKWLAKPMASARRWSRRLLAAAPMVVIGLSLTLPSASAQEWPDRAVRFILPFGAGTATDLAARLIGERLAAKWGQPVVVENRPGGDALVAINAFLSAKDDHALLYASSASFLAHPYTQEKLPYDLDRDLAPIARTANTLLTVATSAGSGVETLEAFVKLARETPGQLNAAGSVGLPDFTLGAFISNEGLKVARVPYRTAPQAANDLAENRIQLLVSSYAVVRSLEEAGRVRVIAVASRDSRSPLLPNVPSAVEAGFPGLRMQTTAGFYGPRTMPVALRERIGRDVTDVLSDKSVAERIAKSGQDIVPAGPKVLEETIREQVASFSAIAKVLGMKRNQ